MHPAAMLLSPAAALPEGLGCAYEVEWARLGVALPALGAESRERFAAAELGAERGGVVTLPPGALEVEVAHSERMPGGRLREPIARSVRRRT